MSRIGKMPIALPPGVDVNVDKESVTVKGPKGTLQQFNMPNVTVTTKEGEIVVERANDERETRSKHGLMRALVQNMVEGVSQGFEKKLEINGVGYRVQAQGADLKFNLGFSHELVYKVPEAVQVSVSQNVLTVSGVSKQQVGQVAAEIRALKKPEPYKGKGIKYVDERIIRKSGKSGKESA